MFDGLNPGSGRAENWGILGTFLGSGVVLGAVAGWKAVVKDAGGKVTKTKEGSLFTGMVVSF